MKQFTNQEKTAYNWLIAKFWHGFLSIASLTLLSVCLISTAYAGHGTTYVVNTTADPGDGVCDAVECTLREAMEAANSNPGHDKITFKIPDSECTPVEGNNNYVCTIQPQTVLPSITDSVEMNGSIKEKRKLPGNPNKRPGIELDMTQVPPFFRFGFPFFPNGLTVTGPDASGTTIQGLIIRVTQATPTCLFTVFNTIPFVGGWENENSCGRGIQVFAANHVTIKGNYFNLDKDGLVPAGNGSQSIWLYDSNNSVIGGYHKNDRNVVSNNNPNAPRSAILVGVTGWGSIAYGSDVAKAANNNQIVGNYVGPNAKGDPPDFSAYAIILQAFNMENNAFGFPGPVAWGAQCADSASTDNPVPGACEMNDNIIKNNVVTSVFATPIEAVGFSDDTVISHNTLVFPENSDNFAGILIFTFEEGHPFGTPKPDVHRRMVIKDNIIDGTLGDVSFAISSHNMRNSLIENNVFRGIFDPTLLFQDLQTFLPSEFNNKDVTIIRNVFDNNLRRNEFLFPFAFVGIDLTEDGVWFGYTPNDNLDLDSDLGANNLQNHPIWAEVDPVTGTGAALTLRGSLNSEAGKKYRLDFYASDTASQALLGTSAPDGLPNEIDILVAEGKYYLGYCVSDRTDAYGDVDFECTVAQNHIIDVPASPGQVPQPLYFIATATELLDEGGNCSGGKNDSNKNGMFDCGSTSEFNPAVEVNNMVLVHPEDD